MKTFTQLIGPWLLLAFVCCAADKNRPALRPGDMARVRSFGQPVEVVGGLADELAKLSTKYPELDGFAEYSRKRGDPSRIRFTKGLRPIKTKRGVRPGDFEPGGIWIAFGVHPSELLVAAQDHQVTYFKRLDMYLFSDACVSEKPSEGLAEALDEMLKRHGAYLQVLEDRKANQ